MSGAASASASQVEARATLIPRPWIRAVWHAASSGGLKVDEGYAAARWCALNLLSTIQAEVYASYSYQFWRLDRRCCILNLLSAIQAAVLPPPAFFPVAR